MILTLGTNVYKMYGCDKNQMPYYNVKWLQKVGFLIILGHLIKHGSHWINFANFTLISEK